ncbi:NACHT domain-containing NTPase [Tolypothrix sp. PCC 7910]|uniref:NACHT domain-containing protein n=1 Tax=Tolypothrix sp. PCC 7910 TaxID=2099387 RepID=UPI001427800B|nr:NACHT domain-containing NTPase [Tolypothrix sp. PCC 7910]QIR38904.1 NACHT domain-containing NTPase [Tolypothrix sp. PCC 7910]
MTGRSLSCSPEGIQQAKKALIRYSLTQKALAEELEVTRQPIGKFFTGKPVDRNLFVQICDRLDLEWEEVVAQPASQASVKADQGTDIDIAGVVKEVRDRIKPLIQERCGTMRVLDMTQPIGLNDIYTSVNILEKITGRRRKEIAELLTELIGEEFERYERGQRDGLGKRVPGLEAVDKYPKLMILGKPGAGKTTFLRYLAIHCIEGKFQGERVPIFITLKDFAEFANKPGLLEYIAQLMGQVSCLASYSTTTSLTEHLLSQGKMLILLDGLDEVREEDSERILKEIREFAIQFQNNHFVMTCRIAAKEYTFEKFTEVEIADFEDEQIVNFAIQWFKGKAVKSDIFIKRIQDNSRIRELATNPLLLTLLCLVFEGSMDFPANRSELYEEGVDALLKKWDASRGIERNQVYKKLSLKRKEELLSKIALITFERGEYFFKQRAAEQYITEYIRNLPDANLDEEELQRDSTDVLRSIEAQHGLLIEIAKGIYSFSHQTFHEYFAAREIVVVKQSSEEALRNLTSHVTEKRWQEIMLLAVGMSPSADSLLQLMKQQIDGLIAEDEKLQKFLIWVTSKSCSVKTIYRPEAVRAFYLTLALYLSLSLYSISDFSFNLVRTRAYAIDLNLVRELGLNPERAFNHDLGLGVTLGNVSYFPLVLARALDLYLTLELALNYNFSSKPEIDIELKTSLEKLKNLLPNQHNNPLEFEMWMIDNSQTWTEQLRAIMIQYRNIGHDWQFNNQQKVLLKQYYYANLLLAKCLNSDCYVSREMRHHLENTLLLPITNIQNT